MADKPKPTYFDQVAVLAKREAELKTYYDQATLLDPVLKELEAGHKIQERIAAALERLATAYELSLGSAGIGTGKGDTAPAPEAIYTDEEEDAVREQLEASGRLTPEMRAALWGGEEKE